jgi:hypothetical protein
MEVAFQDLQPSSISDGAVIAVVSCKLEIYLADVYYQYLVLPDAFYASALEIILAKCKCIDSVLSVSLH